MGNYNIVFLILHYLTFEMTERCVDSVLRNVDTTNFSIIIVDNGSNNGSGERLQARYKEYDTITVLINPDNLGFARGNNIGFCYAKKNVPCDFICMMNNDTILEQRDFMRCVVEEYENTNCAVIGPQIVSADGSITVNARRLGTVRMYQGERLRLQIASAMIHVGIDMAVFPKMLRKIFKKEIRAYFPIDEREGSVEDVVLEGCCLIFTPEYVKRFDGIDDRTFMYGEEELLYTRLKKHRLKSLYSKKLRIRHLEDVSTDMAFRTRRRKKKFEYKNGAYSLGILIQEMKDSGL